MLQFHPPFRFQFLLIALVCLLLVPGVAGEQLLVFLSASFGAVLIASLYLVAKDRRSFFTGCVLAIPTFLLGFELGMDSHIRLPVNHALQIIFLCYVSSHLLRFLMSARTVSSDVLAAALCLYLILGYLWTFLFLLLGQFDPDALMLNANASTGFTETLYFSFVTLTTLGYGDVVPNSTLAQSLAILEAVTGQVFLATIIARLVGMQISASQTSQT